MGGDNHVARWAGRQKAKALHVGTYEAAIHNMLRRIDDQANHGTQFYLYRVRLVPTNTVREGWLIDPSNFVGDVILNEVCPPGIDVTRYLNYHEDPGATSLALGRNAIHSTQQIKIPPPSNEESSWLAKVIRHLDGASGTVPTPSGPRSLGRRREPFPRTSRARELAASFAEQLPVNLRSQFESAATFNDDTMSDNWARYVHGLTRVVQEPAQVLRELDHQPIQRL